MMCGDEEGNLRSSSLKMQLVPFTKSPPTKNCTSNISHSGTIFANFHCGLPGLGPTPTSSPLPDRKNAQKTSLDAVNLFLFGSFWVPFLWEDYIYIYISYITIMKI